MPTQQEWTKITEAFARMPNGSIDNTISGMWLDEYLWGTEALYSKCWGDMDCQQAVDDMIAQCRAVRRRWRLERLERRKKNETKN